MAALNAAVADQDPHDRGRRRAFRRAGAATSCSPPTASMRATAASRSPSSPRCRWEKRVSLSATGYYKHAEDPLGLRHQYGPAVLLFRLRRRRRRSRDRHADRRDPRAARRTARRTAAARSIRRSISARSRAPSCRAWAGSPARNCGGTRRAGCAPHGPSTYKIPGSRDVPPVFNARLLDDAPNPRSHRLPLQGGRRAAADAGDLGLARHPRRGREPRRSSRRAAARRARHARARAGRRRRHPRRA